MNRSTSSETPCSFIYKDMQSVKIFLEVIFLFKWLFMNIKKKSFDDDRKYFCVLASSSKLKLPKNFLHIKTYSDILQNLQGGFLCTPTPPYEKVTFLVLWVIWNHFQINTSYIWSGINQNVQWLTQWGAGKKPARHFMSNTFLQSSKESWWIIFAPY